MTDNNQLTVYGDINGISEQFKKQKNKLQKYEKKFQEMLEIHTKEEKQMLMDAYKKYNEKLEIVLQSDTCKKIEQRAGDAAKEMNEHLSKAVKAFYKMKYEIMKNEDFSTDEKRIKIDEVYEYILNKLYTKDEIEGFKNMIGNIMMINGNNLLTQ